MELIRLGRATRLQCTFNWTKAVKKSAAKRGVCIASVIGTRLHFVACEPLPRSTKTMQPVPPMEAFRSAAERKPNVSPQIELNDSNRSEREVPRRWCEVLSCQSSFDFGASQSSARDSCEW